jgi:hypothetical protein
MQGGLRIMPRAPLHRTAVILSALGLLCGGGLRADEPDVTKVVPLAKVSHFRWVLDPRVQNELKLTGEQQKQLNAALAEVRERHQADLDRAKAAEAKNRFDVAKEALWKVQQTEQQTLARAVPRILTPGQLKRCQQIEWHLRGLHHAFLDEAVQKQLNFTDEQRKGIKRIRDEVRAEALKLLPGPAPDPALVEATEQKFLPAALGKFLDVLTGPQKTTWKELTGEPFQFPAPILPPK